MKKQLGILLVATMILNTVSSTAFGFESPLKRYNLFDDTHPTEATAPAEYERVVNDTLPSALDENGNPREQTPQEAKLPDLNIPTYNEAELIDSLNGRNKALRNSSRAVYSDPKVEAGWTKGPYFYPNPSLDSIILKYRKSNFAGCLQECQSYVKIYPKDTLGYYYMAMCYTKVHDKENAVKAYEKVIELHDNPLIVKYATNGRNCAMANGKETCYPNVNEPELIYPYEHYANQLEAELTPVDPQTLVNQNFSALQYKLNSQLQQATGTETDANGKLIKKEINLPFGEQDSKLDEFINAPYGNGLSPELNEQYKQIQLKKFQETLNNDSKDDKNRLKNIREFDKQKSEAETSIKLAYEPNINDEWEQLKKDPEFIKSQQELNELRMMLGSDNEKKNNNITDIIPYMTEDGAKQLSPETVKNMMIQSVMSEISL